MKDEKLKHLEFIQNIINRMATNSFIIKGWCITIVSTLFVLAEKDTNQKFVIISWLPIIAFWVLNSYFLKIEREYRVLYDGVRKGNVEDFSMDTKGYRICITDTMFSFPILIFYLTLVVVNIIIMCL